ncbi:hypothetical protein EMIHUDRAFT_237830 [Emiliania huxleyi CCMP1516]|uniref:Uncharacterized protein n=2 Tax=Emiliania huxleyi TaxID=2903 RepID=A0A0D3IFH6_EMIH1|nr:hypothetical protein EMIHUDRAFT_216146 [Emiliania huxleyi CCMP1516]XP_005777734.1 hypothetical protein EMIHUDRAFT_237830 [Emiliania huxleyi CCMP1516]EOD10011.1 hypothetical protein EMIHUDRAFT_216146 [Emiliania huxleyi CCMP1516]EOD25305.1 hypothetical protein EMIHUDRAFT_237830 [Emiliania huxleyi CCMP1516]|eukprot:XP_005762440.1 hypothetical protein EMIHUDRAFT_216146 [Emiliania huxleyi CCMP1516]
MPSTSERPWLHEAPQYGLRMLAAVDPDNPAVLRFAAPAEALPEDTRARECGSGDLAAFAEGRGTAPQLELRLPAGGNGSKLWRCALLPCGATDVGEAAAVLHVHGAPSERRVTWMALTTLEPPPISEAAAALVPAFSDAQRFEAEYASLLPPALRSRGFGARLEHWSVAVDPSVEPFLPASAAAACAVAVPPAPAEWAELMVRRKGCTSVELKSPPPPRELRLGRGALADVRLAAALLRWRGCAAPDCGERGAAAMLHCHVNVRSSEGGGELLCARELLSVFCAWLQFEHVAASLTRSWVRRDRWCAPLYATGPEFSFSDKPWAQGGHRPLPPHLLDAPAFLRRAHTLWRGECCALASEEERVQRLFAVTPGRLASLNVEAVLKTGTYEFRRHHATTCGDAARNWCLFCVAFVEAARPGDGACLGRGAEALLDAQSPEQALTRLREAQLLATREGLVALLARVLGEGEARALVEAMAAESCV